MKYINKDLFGIIISETENKHKSFDQVALYPIANAREFGSSEVYEKYMKKVSEATGAFINMRFLWNPSVGSDHESSPAYAYKHTSKGKTVCWITTNTSDEIYQHAADTWDTYFVAIPYKQHINAIKCSDGVEILKISTRTYAKIHNTKGTFNWVNPEYKAKSDDDTTGMHYGKVLYMIVNVRKGSENPSITIDEVRVPNYNLKKDIERNKPKAEYTVSHNNIVLNIPTDCGEGNTNFYPPENISQCKCSFEEAKRLLDIPKSSLMDLISQTPIENETY